MGHTTWLGVRRDQAHDAADLYLSPPQVLARQLRQLSLALHDSQERLNLALDSADLGTWDWHIPSNMLFGSARASKLHGLKEEPFHDDFRKFFSCVPLADRHAMRKHYQNLAQGDMRNYAISESLRYCERVLAQQPQHPQHNLRRGLLLHALGRMDEAERGFKSVVQFHPELKSRPFDPHPLFTGFIEAAIAQSRLV